MTKKLKIVYGAGNRNGAAWQLQEFMAHMQNATIRVATFLASSYGDFIDWNLEACRTQDNYCRMLREIEEFNPDVIISDGEWNTINIANTLEIPLWNCSSLHLIDGVRWVRDQLGHNTSIEPTRRFLRAAPGGEKYFVYSPLCDIVNPPTLRDGFEWVRPYHTKVERNPFKNKTALIRYQARSEGLNQLLDILKIKLIKDKNEEWKQALIESDWIVTTGDTNTVSDAFYNGINICVSPTVGDAEAAMNALMCRNYKIGVDVAQIELMDKYSLDEMEKTFAEFKELSSWPLQINPNVKYLHERLEEL